METQPVLLKGKDSLFGIQQFVRFLRFVLIGKLGQKPVFSFSGKKGTIEKNGGVL